MWELVEGLQHFRGICAKSRARREKKGVWEVAYIAVGHFHNCFVLEGNFLKCWGAASDGRLGHGDTQDWGLSGGQMGDALPVTPL